MATRKMNAAVVEHFGKPLVLREWDVPTPGVGQIVVKTEACGVCHTDLHAANGDWPVKPTLPFIPGHEVLEIQLALSALPPHLRDNATVYVLNPDKGFEVARQGTNGFNAFVARTGDDSFRGSWPLTKYRDDILYPISFDEAGGKAQMKLFFDAAELQAKGTPPEELKKIIQQRYKRTPTNLRSVLVFHTCFLQFSELT